MPNDTAPTVMPPVLAPEPAATMAPIYKALVAAQRAASAVTKDAKNQFHGYKYASAEAVIEEARHALNDAGLALTLLGWDRVPVLSGDHQHPRVEVRYRLVHESGVAVDVSASSYVIPEKGRPPDKAEAGALTTNLSYVLRALLLLPREEEGTSPDTRDDREYSPGRPAPRAEPVPKPTPSVDTTALAGELINKLDQCQSHFDLSTLKPDLQKARPSFTEKQWADEIVPAMTRAKARVDAGTAAAVASQKPEAHKPPEPADAPTPVPPVTEPSPAPTAPLPSPRAVVPPPAAPPSSPRRANVPF